MYHLADIDPVGIADRFVKAFAPEYVNELGLEAVEASIHDEILIFETEGHHEGCERLR